MNDNNNKDIIAESLLAMKQLMSKMSKDELKGITDYIDTLVPKKEQKKATGQLKTSSSHIGDIMPRISHFVDENGNTCDLNAGGVNVFLKKDGTFEYYRSYGFAGRKDLFPIYEA